MKESGVFEALNQELMIYIPGARCPGLKIANAFMIHCFLGRSSAIIQRLLSFIKFRCDVCLLLLSCSCTPLIVRRLIFIFLLPGLVGARSLDAPSRLAIEREANIIGETPEGKCLNSGGG